MWSTEEFSWQQDASIGVFVNDDPQWVPPRVPSCTLRGLQFPETLFKSKLPPLSNLALSQIGVKQPIAYRYATEHENGADRLVLRGGGNTLAFLVHLAADMKMLLISSSSGVGRSGP